MGRTRLAVGIGVSAAYLLVVFCLCDLSAFGAMPLNEQGDFLAGVIGPLSFFWLLLGYLQQGDELKHSTRALELQALELKNSVEQQTKLAIATERQLDELRQSSNLARQQFLRANRARFIVINGNTITSSGQTTYIFKLLAEDATAYDVRFEKDERFHCQNLTPVGVWAPGTEKEYSLRVAPEFSGSSYILIRFRDRNRNDWTQEISVNMHPVTNRPVFESFLPELPQDPWVH